MNRFGLAALTVLLIPAAASADWVLTNFQAVGDYRFNYTVDGGGPQSTRIGFFDNKYFNGPVGDQSSLIEQVISYCATIDETNVGNQIEVVQTTIAAELGANFQLRRQLAYLLNEAESFIMAQTSAFGSFTQDIARGIIQAAVWVVVAPPAVTNGGITSATNPNFATDMSSVLGQVISNATGWFGFDNNDPYWRGLPYPGPFNQDFISRRDGGGDGRDLDPEPSPLPASLYGAMILMGAAAIGGRRMFGLVG